MITSDLRPMFKKVFTLKYEEEPPYEYVIECIQKEIKKKMKDSSEPHHFEWTKNYSSQVFDRVVKEKTKKKDAESNGISEESKSQTTYSFHNMQYKSKPLEMAN